MPKAIIKITDEQLIGSTEPTTFIFVTPLELPVIDPFAYTSGPKDAKVIIVGEAWGVDEARAQSPFVGQSGKELDRMLFEVGIPRSQVLCTNVVDARPDNNDFSTFFYTNEEAKKLKIEATNRLYPRPILSAGLRKLDALVAEVKPTLIIGCGNIPLWALAPERVTVSAKNKVKLPGGIMSWRGSQLFTTDALGRAIPFLPIIHPAAILRAWDLRSPTVHDLKARAKAFLNRELRWDQPALLSAYKPTAKQAISLLNDWLTRADKVKIWLACDIETYRREHIAVIGFADETLELCVPFFHFDKAGNYVEYFTLEEEVEVTELIRKVLTHPNIQILGQNYKYDYQFMYRKLGIKSNFNFDTMLAHHVLWPGTPKSLDYLASLYAHSYVYWKDESQDWNEGLTHEEMWKYNCKDNRYTYEIAFELMNLIQLQGFSEQYQCQLDQWQVTAEMEINGVAIDLMARSQMSQDLIKAYAELEKFLIECMPLNTRFTDKKKPWFTSPTLTMDILYRQLGLPEQVNRKTKKASSDAQSLDALKKKVPWLKPVFERLEAIRSIAVFRSHFIDAKLSRDGRIRCSYNIGGTETFRWSSNLNPFDEGTNLQNIPKGD